MAKKLPFESTKFDKDRGVKEGSPADLKRDAKERKVMRKSAAKAKEKNRGG